jgi:hypothetical protein
MGYYIRVLTPELAPVSPAILTQAIAARGAKVAGDLNVEAWDQLEVSNASGQEVCAIERNAVSTGSLAEEEIGEFRQEISRCLPSSAASWLQTYLSATRTIYAIQLLHGTYVGQGWEIVGSIKDTIVKSVGGIVQADNEGFSNEEGYHILWQFSDDVSGEWWMAVLKEGRWHKFKMDLGNREHRAAFQRGEIPMGVQVASH